jgi:flagellar basal-body rod protein FlgB
MIGKLDESLNFQSTALLLRAERQQLLASNIANADTPGYQARDFDFANALSAATGASLDGAAGPTSGGTAGGALVRTDTRHLDAAGGGSGMLAGVKLQYRAPTQASLDNNSVDIDVERAQFADNSVRYQASLTFLNQKIKNLLSAMSS